MLRRLKTVILIGIVLCVLCSCASYRRDPNKKVFGFTSMNNSNPYFVAMLDEMQAAVEARGDVLIAVDGALSQEKQLNGIENLIVQNIDGIFLNPVEAEGIEPALDALNKAGIPIINYDSPVAALDKVVTYVGSDNVNAGFVCGEDLVKKLPGGDVLIITQFTSDAVMDRSEGFKKAIEGHGFTVVGESDALGDQTEAMNEATDLLQANPGVVAIFCGTDPMTQGALAAAESGGYDLLIYGVDGSPQIKAEMVKGNKLIAGEGAQTPLITARKAVELMYDYLDGKELEAYYPVATFLMNEENVRDYSIDGWQ